MAGIDEVSDEDAKGAWIIAICWALGTWVLAGLIFILPWLIFK